MSTSVNPDGSTNGVSGKLKAAVPAGGLATAIGTTLVFELDKYVHAAHLIFSDAPYLPALLVAGVAAVVTFAAGYVAKHAPAGLVETAREAYVSASANPANLVPASAGFESTPSGEAPPAEEG
jgi:hypothetical protein